MTKISKQIACLLICLMFFLLITGCTENIEQSEVDLTDRSIRTTNSISGDLTTTADLTTAPSTSTSKPETTTSAGDEKEMDNECRLIVKGEDITAENYVKLNYDYRYAELPLIAIVRALGAEVEWQNKVTAIIKFEGKDYILDTTKGTLIEVGGSFNMLAVSPGSRHGTHYQVIENEFVIDSDSAKLLINNIMGATIKINFDEKIVEII